MVDKLNPELMRGSLDLMVLKLLSGQKQYGYLIGQRLKVITGGAVGIKAGTLYPLLHRLESQKLIRSSWDESTGRRRKWYELTSRGEKQLLAQTKEWREFAQCIINLLDGNYPVVEAT